MGNAILIDTRSVLMQIVSPLGAGTNGNVTDSSVSEPIPSVTAPVNNTHGGVIPLGHQGQQTASAVKLVFFGVGADTNTFSAYVYGWEVQRTTIIGNRDLWVPTLLATFTGITLDSSKPGVAGAELGITQLFATAITLGVGNSGISAEVVSPGHTAGEIAHAIIDTKGCRYLEVRFATGSSATSCNALVKRM